MVSCFCFGKKSILLTGDIEKFAEEYLVSSGENLAADILVAPHHGSKTSALDEFVKKVNPIVVLYPIGYRNRYHFPHSSVQQKYEAIGSLNLNTAQSGAIQIKLEGDHILPLELYRKIYRKYWH